MKGDGNIGSILAFLLQDLHVSGIENILRRYICDAMTFHRNRRYFFTDKSVRFSLTAGRRDYKAGDGYGLPADLSEIAGRTIWILISGSNDQREPCVRASTNLFEESVAAWGDSKDYPDIWDFRGNALRFSPTPATEANVAELRYVSNIGIPRVTWEAGATAFYHPTTGENITSTVDTWSNDWTQQEAGALAIRMRAKYAIEKGYLGRSDEAQNTLADWLEAVGQLEDETEGKTSTGQWVEGCIL